MTLTVIVNRRRNPTKKPSLKKVIKKQTSVLKIESKTRHQIKKLLTQYTREANQLFTEIEKLPLTVKSRQKIKKQKQLFKKDIAEQGILGLLSKKKKKRCPRKLGCIKFSIFGYCCYLCGIVTPPVKEGEKPGVGVSFYCERRI